MRIFATQNRSGVVRAVLRAIMFMVGCAIMLAAASPWIPKLAWMWSETFLGAVTSIGAFALTDLFVRWERLELTDVGARPDRWTALRFPCGFAIGLLVVVVWASISAGCGYVHWARGPDVEAELPLSALAAYLALACREELAFHGYPLRNLVRP